MRVRAIVFQTVREIHVIEVDRASYQRWLGGAHDNEDRLREYIIATDGWPDSFNDETLSEAEPWGLDLDRAQEHA